MATQQGVVVNGFRLEETLGEGTFGKVKLATSTEIKLQVAVKIIDFSCPGKVKVTDSDVKKERVTHKLCNAHPNVINSIGMRLTPSFGYLVLELAEGGELFDRIVPDVGVAPDVAHFYFRQLFSAVQYCHSRGVTHRDVKPENILTDSFGNLKLTDFGFATAYRYKGVERKLERKCGTPPYTAPEVYAAKKYDGNLTDYWSCGVVLIALLTGNLPWNKPSIEDGDYALWASGDHPDDHWYSVVKKRNAYGLLAAMLNPDESKRAREKDIEAADWFKQRTHLTKLANEHGMITSVVKELQINEISMELDTMVRPISVQPEERDRKRIKVDYESSQFSQSLDFAQSKPIRRPKVRRETCFNSRLDIPDTIDSIIGALETLLLDKEYEVLDHKNTVVVKTMDQRGNPLHFTARVFAGKTAAHSQFVDFRMREGDGLSFRRKYKEITDVLFKKESIGPCTQTQPFSQSQGLYTQPTQT